ncbi:hypothetical protein [Rhodopirellula sp. UBA1907]|jgi:hypothetical protein|uniref:hypothetical protein n=1 Tax=Rhodopirellula sp. UBA1907 TaxID=1947381 RepID=UPI00055DDAA6|nr:hypothetical protein [Rhodopirellula sp. UBA1907]|tara:strand:- start:13847 stop:14575 length:729 start_codon:yes stop_codon:yes gene_type:complete
MLGWGAKGMDTSVSLFTGFSSKFEKRKFRQFSHFLQALQEAREYAKDLQCSAQEFAISVSDAEAMGICTNDLIWMTRKGWVRTVGSEPFQDDVGGSDSATAGFGRRLSRFELGTLGIQLVQDGTEFSSGEIPDEVAPSPVGLSAKPKPTWDPDRHELTFQGKLVKRFRWPATNQEVVLSAFQEEAWPSRIDDPLPGADDLEPKRRLSDTIKCLNRNQQYSLLRFRGDGTGEGIIWDVDRISA